MTTFNIQFPQETNPSSTQEEYFYLYDETGKKQLIKLHDYATVYQIPGLYEFVVCQKLQYQAPRVISELLIKQIHQENIPLDALAVLDIGAGNGVSGKTLSEQGIKSIIGLDLIPEAAIAAKRDYPGIYQQYYVEDLTCLKEKTHQELSHKNFNILLMMGSLYHLPSQAFYNALNLISVGGWFAVTLRESTPEISDPTTAYYLFEQLINNQTLEIITKQSYVQRLSLFLDKEPIMGVAVIGKKRTPLPIIS